MQFKINQYVVTKGGEEGKIVDYQEENAIYNMPSYQVLFTKKDLVPNRMWYPEQWLEPCNDPEDLKCPICKTQWVETKMGNHVWRDCKPCGKRAEDIEDELKELPPIPTDDGLDLKL